MTENNTTQTPDANGRTNDYYNDPVAGAKATAAYRPGKEWKRQQPKATDKKRSKKNTIIVSIVGLALIGFAASKMGGNSSANTPVKADSVAEVAAPSGDLHEVVYKVTGTTTQASITIQTGSGDTSQANDVDVPLVSQSTGKPGLTQQMDSGDFFYISAQNSKASGTVTCSVEVDGVVVKTTTSSGGYAIATCSGTV